MIVQVQAPDGASLEYTGTVAQQAESIIRKQPEVQETFSVTGFSFAGAAPNRGIMFINLKPIATREGDEHSAMALVGRLRQELASITGALVIPFQPPPIFGLGALGGFQFELLDQSGGPIERLGTRRRGSCLRPAINRRQMRGLFSSFTATDPQLVVDIDREKPKSLGMKLSRSATPFRCFSARST